MKPNQNMQLILVTPAYCKALLEGMENFRRLRPERVSRLAEIISQGGWVTDANPIKLDTCGRLIDGQHRCSAIVLSGKAVWSWVCSGVESDITIDTGVSRTIRDYLYHRGEKNTSMLASVLYLLWQYLNGKTLFQPMNRPSIDEMITVLGTVPNVRESVAKVASLRRPACHSQVAFLHTVVSQSLPHEANRFVELFSNGANLTQQDPIYRLRERLTSEKKCMRLMPQLDRLALTIIAWNKWLHGEPCRQLSWRSIGPSAEKFPEIQTNIKGAA